MANILNQNIISELGLDTLEPEKQMEILEKVGKIIFQGVLIKVTEIMEEDDLDKLNNLLEQGDGDELLTFMQAKVPNLDEIIKQEVAKIKEQSLDFMNQL